MTKICDFFIHKINKSILMISSIIFVLFMVIVLPKASTYMENITGTKISPDTNLLYNRDDLFNIASVYGQEGRDAYIFLRFTFDLVWPIVYFIFLVSFISILIQELQIKRRYKYLLFLPIFGVIFDFLENIFCVIVMNKYPTELMLFAQIAPIMTLFKWIFMGMSICSIFILIILLIFKKK